MMRLYDTARREVVPFDAGPVVKIYTCGITPYDAAHLGHAAVYLAFDVLQRRLRDLGHRTQCVRNVTDVDDPLLAKARELLTDSKLSLSEVALAVGFADQSHLTRRFREIVGVSPGQFRRLRD